MKKGFTLIELIFAIVIIGVLAAVAVPKFTNLKQNAEAKSVIKVAEDAYGSIPSAYVNAVDVDDQNASAIVISNLVDVSGKGWVVTDSAPGGTIVYTDSAAVVTLTLNDRTVRLQYNCAGFSDSNTQDKCKSDLGISTDTLDKNMSF